MSQPLHSFSSYRSCALSTAYTRLLLVSGIFLSLFFLTIASLHPRTSQHLPTSVTSAVHGALEKIHPSQHEKLAYTTFLAGTVASSENITANDFDLDVYFQAARLLGYHVMHKPSTRTRRGVDWVVLVTPTVPELKKERLRADGAIVVEVDPVETGDWFHPGLEKWSEVMSKLRLWQLTEYDRMLFLDTDSVLIKNIDGIWEDPGAMMVKSVREPVSPVMDDETPIPEKFLFASVPESKPEHNFPPKDSDFWHGHNYFNAGFFMLSPSTELFDHYLSIASPANASQPKFNSACPEQNLLNYAHRREGAMPWQDLAVTWNIIRASKKDIDRGAFSLHTKWWNANQDIQEFLGKELERMKGFYEGWDERRREVEGAVVPGTAMKLKRWVKKQVYEWTDVPV
ncbi:glycosyltransferase family 8 protein [Patellaria atrata CBS 101060]|uniref:Glycosyltransferase family 8 protein n=1 Tax=Patellaria atrata CBS 101060 TaxID=1346257 RepID=A0A9P4S1Y3_9PEZI|nr:glycosyltransferase family 8 protein [Patellaria atrata CBS 101060]